MLILSLYSCFRRKCYKLVQYMSRDLIQDIVNFDDVSSADTERNLRMEA
jgi:hypothetical protein